MALPKSVGDCLHVLAGITALGNVVTAQTRQDAAGESVHLRAEVVDVVLGSDIGSGSPQNADQSIADGGPARVSQVQRASGVG